MPRTAQTRKRIARMRRSAGRRKRYAGLKLPDSRAAPCHAEQGLEDSTSIAISVSTGSVRIVQTVRSSSYVSKEAFVEVFHRVEINRRCATRRVPRSVFLQVRSLHRRVSRTVNAYFKLLAGEHEAVEPMGYLYRRWCEDKKPLPAGVAGRSPTSTGGVPGVSSGDKDGGVSSPSKSNVDDDDIPLRRAR